MANARDSNSTSTFGFAVRALRYRNYRLFFAGQSVSLVGTWMTKRNSAGDGDRSTSGEQLTDDDGKVSLFRNRKSRWTGDVEILTATEMEIRVGGNIQKLNRNSIKRVLLIERVPVETQAAQ
jgi:hypothetical protein